MIAVSKKDGARVVDHSTANVFWRGEKEVDHNLPGATCILSRTCAATSLSPCVPFDHSLALFLFVCLFVCLFALFCFHGACTSDGSTARFRIEEEQVVGGSFDLEHTRYTLDSLHHAVRWATLDAREKALFSSQHEYERLCGTLLVMYHLKSLNWPHDPFANKSSGFASCNSDNLSHRAAHHLAQEPSSPRFAWAREQRGGGML